MKSWDCTFAGQGDNRHEQCNGTHRAGNMATPLVVIYECACECHGPDRDGHEIRRYADHADEADPEWDPRAHLDWI